MIQKLSDKLYVKRIISSQIQEKILLFLFLKDKI